MKTQFNKATYAVLFILVIALPAIFFVGYYAARASYPSGATPVFEHPIGDYSYLIWQDGSTYYAKNGSVGTIDYSGTNAHMVIQNAIDALDSSGGKIFLRNGVYGIGDNFGEWLRPTEATDALVIQGESRDGTILRLTSSDGNQSSIISYGYGGSNPIVKNYRIQDLTLDGNYPSVPQDTYLTSGLIVLSGNIETATIENVRIYRPNGFGIFVGSSGLQYVIHNSIFEQNGQAPEAVHYDNIGGGTSRLTATDNVWKTSTGSLIDLTNARQTVFSNNKAYDQGTTGVYILGNSSTVIGNTLLATVSIGIGYDASTAEANRANNTVIGNTLSAPTISIGTRTKYNDTTYGNSGWISEWSGTSEASNDDWIEHNLAGEPTYVDLTIEETDARYFLQLKATNSTHFQIYLYDDTAAASETVDKTINWYAEHKPEA